MMDPDDVPPVESDELLARFILTSKHIRGDNRLAPDAFMPYPHRELSVNRHKSSTEEELWRVGNRVATQRMKTLYGRGDVAAGVCFNERLRVEAAPIPGNPNHANIVNWPDGKPGQKIVALVLAANAIYVKAPQ